MDGEDGSISTRLRDFICCLLLDHRSSIQVCTPGIHAIEKEGTCHMLPIYTFRLYKIRTVDAFTNIKVLHFLCG